jgi:arylsulfatase A-like enzyme
MHYVTDGKWKFVWKPLTNEKLFFHLATDPQELHDLMDDPNAADEQEKWEQYLVRELADQPEGLSDGRQLFPGHMPVYRGAPTDHWKKFGPIY